MKGLARIKNHPIISLKPSGINVTNDEGKFVFVGKIYGSRSVNNDPLKVSEFLENFTIFNNTELLTAENGIYNWLMYSNDDSIDIKFAAIQIISPFELGTTHQSMVYHKKINASIIYGAGELNKEDNQITFNLLSGTYAKKLTEFDFDKSVKNDIMDKFIELFPDSIYHNTRDSYVHKVKTISNKLLESYKNIGYIVKTFELSNDFVKFHNSFWNTDFQLEYYANELNKEAEKYSILQTSYIQILESMIKLVDQ